MELPGLWSNGVLGGVTGDAWTCSRACSSIPGFRGAADLLEYNQACSPASIFRSRAFTRAEGFRKALYLKFALNMYYGNLTWSLTGDEETKQCLEGFTGTWVLGWCLCCYKPLQKYLLPQSLFVCVKLFVDWFKSQEIFLTL